MLTLFFFKAILPVGKLIGDIIGDLYKTANDPRTN